MAEPARAWTPRPPDDAAEETAAPGTVGTGAGPAAAGRPAATLAAEAKAAQADFRKAAGAASRSSRPPSRAAALQAFFVANTARGLMPAGETSGVLSPNLRSEET